MKQRLEYEFGATGGEDKWVERADIRGQLMKNSSRRLADAKQSPRFSYLGKAPALDVQPCQSNLIRKVMIADQTLGKSRLESSWRKGANKKKDNELLGSPPAYARMRARRQGGGAGDVRHRGGGRSAMRSAGKRMPCIS